MIYCQIDNMYRISELGDLQYLNLNANKITKIEGLENKPSLTNLNLSDNKITKIEGLENKQNLTYLNLANNKIIQVEGLENLTNLKTLDLTSNQITDITPLSVNSSLTTLNLKGNTGIDGNRSNYTGERLEALNKIREILDRNGTIKIDIGKIGLFTNYKTLDLSNQNLTTLEPLEGLTELTSLILNSNQLTLEDANSQQILKSMTNLVQLNLDSNKIIDVTAINSLENLRYLNLDGVENDINLVEMEDIISNLSMFNVSTESLKTIVNCDANKITKLRLISSSVTEIPNLSKFTKLNELDLLDSSRITDLSTISNITSLQTLDLSNTNLHGRMIDFAKLTNLTTLNLSNNTLWTEDLENLKALRNNKNLMINLRSNSIIDASVLLELDPSCKIDLRYNVNLIQESKDALKERFGNNVSF